MTLSNGNIFRVTGPLWGEPPVTGGFPSQRPVTRSFEVFFDLPLSKRWANNRDAGDLRRHRAHYDVIVMSLVLDDLKKDFADQTRQVGSREISRYFEWHIF